MCGVSRGRWRERREEGTARICPSVRLPARVFARIGRCSAKFKESTANSAPHRVEMKTEREDFSWRSLRVINTREVPAEDAVQQQPPLVAHETISRPAVYPHAQFRPRETLSSGIFVLFFANVLRAFVTLR